MFGGGIVLEEPLSVAVCEDTESDLERLLEVLAASPVRTVVSGFRSGEELLAAYEPEKFDLLLSDIYMGGMTGIEAVSRIRETDEDLTVAFITTSTDHALESYRLSALKYIEKPFRQKDVDEILKLALLERSCAPALVISSGGREERIRFSRILYLEQQTHELNIHLRDGSTVQYREKLSSLLPQLPGDSFLSPHKSFAVNLSGVCSVDQELRCFVMQDGKNVPIRRESMSLAKHALEDYLFSKTRGLSK